MFFFGFLGLTQFKGVGNVSSATGAAPRDMIMLWLGVFDIRVDEPAVRLGAEETRVFPRQRPGPESEVGLAASVPLYRGYGVETGPAALVAFVRGT